MSRHCSSVKSVGYDLSFIAPLPQNLTPTRRVNNSPDQMSLDNNWLKFSKPCNGHALRECSGINRRNTVSCFVIHKYGNGKQRLLVPADPCASSQITQSQRVHTKERRTQFNRMTEALGRRMDRQLRTAMAAATP